MRLLRVARNDTLGRHCEKSSTKQSPAGCDSILNLDINKSDATARPHKGLHPWRKADKERGTKMKASVTCKSVWFAITHHVPLITFRPMCVAAIVIGLGLASPQPAHAGRAVPWAPGRPVIVYLTLAQTTQIVLPGPMGNFSNPDSRTFSILRAPDGILIKPLLSFERYRLFLFDSKGQTYMVELLETTEGQREDDAVHLVPETFQAPVPQTITPPMEALMLLGAMKLEQPVPGYEIQDGGGKIIFEEPHVIRYRARRVYEGPTNRGFVLEIENLSNEPQLVTPEGWHYRGMVLGSITDKHLAPREPAETIEAFKGMPRKTMGYLVVDRMMFETGGGEVKP
ncbi:MAG: type-F conjugative transfer system secretin TraK [Nitrospirae bacterium]|nr:type-F conjugative transfer system secretin TraK [Nitrospirota bacterium]